MSKEKPTEIRRTPHLKGPVTAIVTADTILLQGEPEDAKAKARALREEYKELGGLMEFFGSEGGDELLPWIWAASAALDVIRPGRSRSMVLPPGIKWMHSDMLTVRNKAFAALPRDRRTVLVAEARPVFGDHQAYFGLVDRSDVRDIQALLYEKINVFDVSRHPPFALLYAPDAAERFIRWKGNFCWLAEGEGG